MLKSALPGTQQSLSWHLPLLHRSNTRCPQMNRRRMWQHAGKGGSLGISLTLDCCLSRIGLRGQEVELRPQWCLSSASRLPQGMTLRHLEAVDQFRSLTHFYSVAFSQSRISQKSVRAYLQTYIQVLRQLFLKVSRDLCA